METPVKKEHETVKFVIYETEIQPKSLDPFYYFLIIFSLSSSCLSATLSTILWIYEFSRCGKVPSKLIKVHIYVGFHRPRVISV